MPVAIITDSGGSFMAMFSVPTATSTGGHTVEASDVTGLKATASFNVPNLTGPAGPPGPSGITYSYQVNWLNVDRTLTIPVGAETTVPVTFANLGSKTWPAGGNNRVALSYHHSMVTWDGLRTFLPYDIAPGKSITVNAAVKAPNTPGSYILLFDLVEEAVTWFQPKGSPLLEVAVSVPSQYAANIVVRYIPTLRAGTEVVASVTVTNTGSKKWLAGGSNPVRLTYHWVDTAGSVVVWDGLRTYLAADVSPSELVLLQAKLKAPASAGTYLLILDLVEEGITWFQPQGALVWQAQVVVLP